MNLIKRSPQNLQEQFVYRNFIPSQTELTTIRTILRTIIVEDQKVLKFDIQGYASSFFHFINLSNSVISKQISKSQEPFDIPFWKSILVEMLRHTLSSSYGFIPPFQSLEKFHEYVDVYGSSALATYSGNSQIANLFLLIHNTMLDLYFLTRVFKKTSPSFLTVCYFGDTHINSIINILSTFFGYKSVFYKKCINQNRCIEIDQPIYLDADIQEAQEHYDTLFSTNFSKNRISPKKKVKEKKVKECPPGKERNPKTGRCVSLSSKNIKEIKECPPGQERNPETGRCKKSRKVSRKKSRKIALKECPPGKERNPKTGRCISLSRKKSRVVSRRKRNKS